MLRIRSAVLVFSTVLAACSNMGYKISADDLEAASKASGTTSLEQVNDLVQDSQTKCSQFMNSLFTTTATTNSVLDITNTIFSALATVFTPLSTVHALTAGGTIAAGTKT